MAGILYSTITINTENTGFRGLSWLRENPWWKYTEISIDDISKGGTCPEDAFSGYATSEDYVPFFIMPPSDDSEPGFMWFCVYEINTENVNVGVNFCSAGWLGYQGTINAFPYGQAGAGVTFNSMDVETTYPIFNNTEDALEWINSDFEIITNILNYYAPDVDDNETYHIYNTGVICTWSLSGHTPFSQPEYRWVNFKCPPTTRVSLYKIPGITGASLRYGVKITGPINFIEKSTNAGLTWETVETFPYEYFWRPRENELGTFFFSLDELDTWLPIFEDEETAEHYNADDGTVDITDAVNWSNISTNYGVTNGTEEGETETEFGEVYTRGFFSQQYILNATALAEVSNDLFDTSIGGIWEGIKKGLDMYGDNPMDAVQGLSFFPVDLTQVFTTATSQRFIFFGGYQLTMTNAVHKILAPNGYKSLGTMRILPRFGNYLDYSPYCRCFVSLPYCGTYEIDLDRYYNKSTEVRYYIDTRTNGCLACLIADGILIDKYNGQMGVTMPITLTDYSAYMNSQLNTLLGAIPGVTGTISQGAQMASKVVNSRGAVGGDLLMGGASAMVGGALEGAKVVYGLSQNNINNFNKTQGTSSSMLNEYLPQYVYFIFEYVNTTETKNLLQLEGKPSNASGNIENFTGFLQVDSVNLKCGRADEEEKAKIVSYLSSGVYI